ncbi:winged helix DNA-binding domain-containing protein [Luteococcus sediminum]
MTPIPAIPEDLCAVLGLRLAAQHLDRPAPDVATVVRDSLAVQAQDPPLSRWSLGVRAGADESAVRAAIDSGQVLRTHVLRPTWHYVHREDIRWLLELTGPRIITGNRARQRQLGIDEELWAQTQEVLRRALADGPLTRRQVQPVLPVPASSPQPNQTVAHQLMMAEASALVCSGPLAGDEHTYVLLDDVVPPSPPLPRQEAATRLVHRFVAGHGPTSLRDLQRWSNITRTEARAAWPAAASRPAPWTAWSCGGSRMPRCQGWTGFTCCPPSTRRGSAMTTLASPGFRGTGWVSCT